MTGIGCKMASVQEDCNDTNIEGGFDLKAVEKDSNIQCSICLHLLRDAMGTPCSHLFCRGCIWKLVGRDGNKKESFKCPECRETVSEDKIYACPFADRLVKGADVYCSCKDEGCQWVGTLASFFEQHKRDCIFQIVPCHHEGCNYSGVKRKIKNHESNCKHRMVECKHCQAPVKENDIEEHYLSCEKIPSQCPQNGCDILLPKNELKEHLNEVCPFAIVECIYSKLGCHEKVLRKDLDKHNNESTNGHMAFICEQLYKTQSTSNKEISKLQEENKQLKAINEELSAKVKMLTRFCPDFQIKEYLLQGTDKFIKKVGNSGLDEDYQEWYDDISKVMLQHKLYRTGNGMFMKLARGEKMYWYSTYQRVNVSDDSDCFSNLNEYSLKIDDGDLVLTTETRFDFTWKNSRAFVLHPSDPDKIKSINGNMGVSYNHWEIPLPQRQVSGFRGAIICLINI